jgi:alpha-L-fucosidase 2
MNKFFSGKILVLSLFGFTTGMNDACGQPAAWQDLFFDSLATRWDEAIPQGNGWLGALVWRKSDQLRISLDRVDLWDDRPMPEIDRLKFKWVVEQVKKNEYDTVQRLGDWPYEKYPAPTKIPGAALEFEIQYLGKAVANRLHIENGLNEIRFDNGIVFNSYIHAVDNIGYFGITLPVSLRKEKSFMTSLLPSLIVPTYHTGKDGASGNSVEGQGLERLGYVQGELIREANMIRYHQPTWQKNFYEVLVQWEVIGDSSLIGRWTISQNTPAVLPPFNAQETEPTGWDRHIAWWKDYWSRSAINIPDSLLLKQYYLEMYKFGCVARSNTPPISLQAIWTADNGNLPPWKGDFHHDLNTQLSYWPGYASNHTDLTSGYTNWLWDVRAENKRWTKQYFGLEGLNVPGVTTISGKEMGGWIQYSTSSTTAAWLAQHFYWQWKYTMDEKFLREKVYAYYKDVKLFLSQLLKKGKDGKMHLPLSSSPEYHDNTIRAWFPDFTNYDLSLLKFFYKSGAEVEGKVNVHSPVEWLNMSDKLPLYASDSTGLMISAGQRLDESHRHHAHLMPIYPLGLMNGDDAKDTALLNRTLLHLEQTGTRWWTGYSFTWAACIYARARQAAPAWKNLQLFARYFCSPNSFHLNGDQSGGKYSNFTYRPFTLEGNFAFAQGIHEMLLQSHRGYIEVFPAVPAEWRDCSFTTLRAEGAVLVSAERKEGITRYVEISATAPVTSTLRLPFSEWDVTGIDKRKIIRGAGTDVTLPLQPGQAVRFTGK